MISPISSDLSLSCAQLYHHLRTQSQVIPVYLSMQWWWVNAEYSIHPVLHTQSTALSQDRLSPATSQLSSHRGPYCTQLSTFPRLRVNQRIQSQLPSHLPPDLPPPDRPPAITPPILIDHGLQVHLQTRSITASKWISEFTQSRSPKLARSHPSSASRSSLALGLQVHLWVHSISVSNCISKLARSRPPSPSLMSEGEYTVKQG